MRAYRRGKARLERRALCRSDLSERGKGKIIILGELPETGGVGWATFGLESDGLVDAPRGKVEEERRPTGRTAGELEPNLFARALDRIQCITGET
jgi:hypothetical protein